jgi:hypothetical protein
MATYQSSLIANNTPPKTAVQGVISKTINILITAALDVTGNIWQLFKIPAGATVLGIFLSSDKELDSSTGALLSVGDADSGTYYISSNAAVGRASANGIFSANAVPKTYTADEILLLTLTAQSTTHANDTNIYVTALYTLDE